MESLSKREKLKAAKKAKITRRVPQVACTLCWAHGTPPHVPGNEDENHLEIFYPEEKTAQPAKKITTNQNISKAETRQYEETILLRDKTEPKNLDELLRNLRH